MKMKRLFYSTLFFASCMVSTNAAALDDIGICADCHGTSSSTQRHIPTLAGQNEQYIFNQSLRFKSGEREDIFMSDIFQMVDEQFIKKVAAYYAGLTPDKNSIDASKAAKGKAIYAESCSSCHGDNGMGDENIARLATQKSLYIKKQLRAFRSGKRKSDMMSDVAAELSDKQISLLAEYVSSM